MLFPTSPFRRYAVAGALVLGPVFFVAESVLAPDGSGTPDQQFTAISSHLPAARLSVVFFALSQLALLVAALGLMRLMRTGAPRLSTVGGALAVVGSFGHGYVAGASATMLTLAQPQLAGADPVRTYDTMHNAWPFLVFAGPSMLCFALGWLLLCVALWRSRVAGRLVPVGILVALVLDFGVSGALPVASDVAGVLLLAALGVIAYRVVARDGAAVPEPQPAAA